MDRLTRRTLAQFLPSMPFLTLSTAVLVCAFRAEGTYRKT